MADNSMTFSNTLMQLGGEDFLRELTEFMLNRIMEADVTQRINAESHERSDERETYRNGYRDRQYNTRLGTLDLRIPKLREGSYFPSFLEARRLSEKALNAVIQEAWINGVSTRKVDALVQSMGMTGISCSQVSSICRGIDERVQAFLHRPLEGEWPYLPQRREHNPASGCGADGAERRMAVAEPLPAAAQRGGDRSDRRKRCDRCAATQRLTDILPDRKAGSEFTPP